MGKFFDITEVKSKQIEPKGDKSDAMSAKFLQAHLLKVDSVKDLLGSLPIEGEIFFIWTVKSFNAFTFIPYLIKYAGSIDELVITSYSINIRIFDSLFNFYKSGKIKSIKLLISESMKFRMPNVVDHINSIITNNPGIIISYEWVHAKVSLVAIGDAKYIIEGSGNWAENAKHEQYIFMRSHAVFNFRKNWIQNEIYTGAI